MSVHISAQPGDVADVVLLPGDPLRAEYVAKTFLTEAVLYNRVRGMLGFTGYFGGRRISVQGTGMGIPSALIYGHELIAEYGVKILLRIGSAGSLHTDLGLHSLVLAMSACTDSSLNRQRFNGAAFAPTADFELLHRAATLAQQRDMSVRVGSVLTSDQFYQEDPDFWRKWADYGVLCAEMETAALYTLAAQHGVRALSLLTISDNMATGASMSSAERERGFADMVELALTLGTSHQIGDVGSSPMAGQGTGHRAENSDESGAGG